MGQSIVEKTFTSRRSYFTRDNGYARCQNGRTLTPPLEYERGLKDTVRTTSGEVTTIAMHFKERTGDYVWHCHVLEHEDNEMMRPLKIIK